MKFKMNWLNSAFVVLVSAGLCCGCWTVTPKQTVADRASWDSSTPESCTNQQNSGFLGWTANGGLITANARARYNNLVAQYGTNFNPVLVKDTGIQQVSTNIWEIDKQHLADFATMNRWRRNGK
jgi:hypothetical protein